VWTHVRLWARRLIQPVWWLVTPRRDARSAAGVDWARRWGIEIVDWQIR
jgi:hypothetical protein